MRYLDPPNTWFLESIQVIYPNGISNDPAVFAGLTNVTNRQIHRPCYYVCSNRPYRAIAAMRPKKLTASYA